MADETKAKTAPLPILEWIDGDADLVCAGPACTFGASVTVPADDGQQPAEASAVSADKPA